MNLSFQPALYAEILVLIHFIHYITRCLQNKRYIAHLHEVEFFKGRLLVEPARHLRKPFPWDQAGVAFIGRIFRLCGTRCIRKFPCGPAACEKKCIPAQVLLLCKVLKSNALKVFLQPDRLLAAFPASAISRPKSLSLVLIFIARNGWILVNSSTQTSYPPVPHGRSCEQGIMVRAILSMLSLIMMDR